jgi:hypothetical protein
MRNTLILVVICLGLFSCNKKYTCECVEKDTKSTYASFEVNSVKENQAKDKCVKYEGDYNATFLGTSTSPILCEIK